MNVVGAYVNDMQSPFPKVTGVARRGFYASPLVGIEDQRLIAQAFGVLSQLFSGGRRRDLY